MIAQTKNHKVQGMKGSVKQIEWAESIKYAVQQEIDSMLHLPEAVALNNNDSAAFWIDRRRGSAIDMIWGMEEARINKGFADRDDDAAVSEQEAEEWFYKERTKVDALIKSLKAKK